MNTDENVHNYIIIMIILTLTKCIHNYREELKMIFLKILKLLKFCVGLVLLYSDIYIYV